MVRLVGGQPAHRQPPVPAPRRRGPSTRPARPGSGSTGGRPRWPPGSPSSSVHPASPELALVERATRRCPGRPAGPGGPARGRATWSRVIPLFHGPKNSRRGDAVVVDDHRLGPAGQPAGHDRLGGELVDEHVTGLGRRPRTRGSGGSRRRWPDRGSRCRSGTDPGRQQAVAEGPGVLPHRVVAVEHRHEQVDAAHGVPTSADHGVAPSPSSGRSPRRTGGSARAGAATNARSRDGGGVPGGRSRAGGVGRRPRPPGR